MQKGSNEAMYVLSLVVLMVAKSHEAHKDDRLEETNSGIVVDNEEESSVLRCWCLRLSSSIQLNPINGQSPHRLRRKGQNHFESMAMLHQGR
ncbi:hypothetical protein PBY51_006724 [Eleginops maclovinus]|uniref:Secreted protein n=1 Tax=Eleginops maclovinus TaxID=56733 RepID=A0AAN7X3Y6_ELEMC|nr:hypothetical protein PBY51_006724 [Eleginops maclovinus]